MVFPPYCLPIFVFYTTLLPSPPTHLLQMRPPQVTLPGGGWQQVFPPLPTVNTAHPLTHGKTLALGYIGIFYCGQWAQEIFCGHNGCVFTCKASTCGPSSNTAHLRDSHQQKPSSTTSFLRRSRFQKSLDIYNKIPLQAQHRERSFFSRIAESEHVHDNLEKTILLLSKLSKMFRHPSTPSEMDLSTSFYLPDDPVQSSK
jgi:hypothetical protein